MSWKEYARLSSSFKWPFVLRVQTREGQLLYFGAAHTYNPADPQITEIAKLWIEFHPTVAFNEGGNPPAETSRAEAVSKHGEAGLVRFLAARDNVRVQSIDPTRAAEVAELLKKFPAEEVKLFFVLRVAAQHG